MERCPKCNSIYIQYDKFTEECYCLEKSCLHRWKMELNPDIIQNDYLRISIE